MTGSSPAPKPTTHGSGFWTMIGGALATALGFVAPFIPMLPPKVGAIIGAVGAIATAFGVKAHVAQQS